MGKFRQFFMELSARNMTMAGYYSLTFLFKWFCIFNKMVIIPIYGKKKKKKKKKKKNT